MELLFKPKLHSCQPLSNVATCHRVLSPPLWFHTTYSSLKPSSDIIGALVRPILGGISAGTSNARTKPQAWANGNLLQITSGVMVSYASYIVVHLNDMVIINGIGNYWVVPFQGWLEPTGINNTTSIIININVWLNKTPNCQWYPGTNPSLPHLIIWMI